MIAKRKTPSFRPNAVTVGPVKRKCKSVCVKTPKMQPKPKRSCKKKREAALDEMMPVLPTPSEPDVAGRAAIIDYVGLCKDLLPAYLDRIAAAEVSVRRIIINRQVA